jgi:hypothetical protein
MKIAIGLITTIFGVLLVMLSIITDAAYIVKSGMGPGPSQAYLVGAVLIVAGCVVFELGIREK